jgi:plastocyanin
MERERHEKHIALALAFLLASQCFGASLSGRVELVDSRAPAVRHHDYSGVAVWLEPAGTPQTPAPIHAHMLQKDKTFQPHLLIVTVGSTVDFPNLDPIFHNAFSNYDGQIFDVGLYPPGANRSIRFSRPGIVRVFCNIHSSMSAVIVVLDTPLFGITRTDGGFEIDGVADGEYELAFFHERSTQAALRTVGRRIAVSGDRVTIPPVAISETGYLSIPHKNKYGQDYPPASGEPGYYPGTHK